MMPTPSWSPSASPCWSSSRLRRLQNWTIRLHRLPPPRRSNPMANQKRTKQKAPEGHLWIEDAAAYIGVAYHTLRKWRVQGKGPTGFPIGGRYIAYRIADLDAYLEGQHRAAIEPD